MKATAKQLNELRRLIEFFTAWYGITWEFKLRMHAGLYREQLARILDGRVLLNSTVIPRLRQLEANLLAVSACDVRRAKGPA